MNDLTLLVNTSDGFEDCWAPFFTLLARYWPDCPYPIVLNTETKAACAAALAGLPVQSARVARHAPKRLTWSECLARCLDAITTPYVLYLQEDFFLEAPVQQPYIDSFLNEMRAGRADVIRLMECGGAGPWRPSANALLWEVDQSAQYRIALQAALWRKSTLRAHLRLHESPWQMEVFGSARARRLKDRVLCVNRDRFHGPGKEVFPLRAHRRRQGAVGAAHCRAAVRTARYRDRLHAARLLRGRQARPTRATGQAHRRPRAFAALRPTP